MTRCSTNRSQGGRLDALTTRHAAIAACVLLALAGCASMAPRVDSGAAIDVPDAWSVTDPTAAASPVTLAGVLSLPLTLPGGAPFPARDLAVLLAMGVIVVSLVAASIGLPLLLKGLVAPADPSFAAEEVRARVAAAHAAIAEIERLEKQRSDQQPEARRHASSFASWTCSRHGTWDESPAHGGIPGTTRPASTTWLP